MLVSCADHTGRTAAGWGGTRPSTILPGRRLRVLVLASLFPSTARPRHGIFVETRLRHMIATGDIDARVVAPLPWFPSRAQAFGSYGRLAATPARENRSGIDVRYPRYFMAPRVGMRWQPGAEARAVLRAVNVLAREGFEPDVIDAHYFYPDGVAAMHVAAALGKPFVVTARGSDLNTLAELPRARTRILEAANRASAVICVSAALRDRALMLGVPGERLVVVRNGVDTTLFTPKDRGQARAALDLPLAGGPFLLGVGNLVPEKGLDLAIRMLPLLPDAALLLIGDGPEEQALRALAATCGVSDRLHIVHPMPQQRLAYAYSAADVLLLPSTREGWPNVLLEAMACGTPVAAAAVGGVREIVVGDAVGRMIDNRDPQVWCDAVRTLLHTRPDRECIRQFAATFGWSDVAQAHAQVLRQAASPMARLGREAACATS